MNNTDTVWIAKVPTAYEWTAVDTDAERAIVTACTAALKWLKEQGVTEHRTVDDVRDYFGVYAFAVKVGTAVREGVAESHA